MPPVVEVRDQTPLFLLLEGAHDLVFECKKCQRQQKLDVQELIRKHGPETTVRFIRKSHTCQCE